MRAHFTITYDVVTAESAEYGETSDAGGIDTSGNKVTDCPAMSLRDAYNVLQHEGHAIEADHDRRTLIFASSADYATGEETTRTLHIARDVTPASRIRIARMFGIR